MTGPRRPATRWLAREGRPAAAFRRLGLPIACYYAVTIALPVANGAAQRGAAFVEHALVVLVVPPILILLVCAIHASAQTLASVFALKPDTTRHPQRGRRLPAVAPRAEAGESPIQ